MDPLSNGMATPESQNPSLSAGIAVSPPDSGATQNGSLTPPHGHTEGIIRPPLSLEAFTHAVVAEEKFDGMSKKVRNFYRAQNELIAAIILIDSFVQEYLATLRHIGGVRRGPASLLRGSHQQETAAAPSVHPITTVPTLSDLESAPLTAQTAVDIGGLTVPERRRPSGTVSDTASSVNIPVRTPIGGNNLLGFAFGDGKRWVPSK
ncbi:hypothetical protein M427DRAFT_35094 [Gonapodya prolifera JEL478]|uniref:Uncharacterized protein n=1 Tax=Gonapodya prolifera (strain JEL478) TaxID=1344416 RepID=A0A139A5H5_GONPJ|nr:hypothetical protein M427DRAFT_35094 [Gonapodya prolifera JEL478]|eukprot:KXS12026.1 hypothetical protein M427DRAFT_35094 [Gonapodya prolifera JEL478]